MKSLLFNLLFTFIVLDTIVSCKHKNTDPAPASSTPSVNVSVNEWILEQMKIWYLWNDKIPATTNTTLAPDQYFESLLYKYDATLKPDGDRFSWIEPNVNKLEASLSGESKSTGVEMSLYLKSGSDDLAGKVFYINSNTPAEKSGIKRGDVITQIKVDGQVVTKNNYGTLLYEGTNYEYTLGSFANGNWTATSDIKKITATTIQKDPLYLDSIYVLNGKKIGYLVYNQFVESPSGSSSKAYNLKMDKIFGKFKAAAVQDLIIDLRYNPGGYVSASINLASLIAKNINKDKVFAQRQYNSSITPLLEKQYGKSFFFENFIEKAENIGSNLSRIYILTSSRSASASELVINGLKPYMDVFLIGNTTVGKNVGSITIKDDKGRHTWGLQPIVVRSANSLGNSDYTAGFKPNISVIETLSGEWFALGDGREALLNEALFQITGNRTARRGFTNNNDPKPINTTFEINTATGMIFEQKALAN